MDYDQRHIDMGREIPSEGYCDQPYVVRNDDGSWTCVMTTGSGHEGDAGQHVVSVITRDRGKTWEGPFDIEPADGPEASWAMPLRVPETGRIYAFYTYNRDNIREIETVNGETIDRVDSFGVYAYKYSDDQGRTWSDQRYEIPMREFECDRNNVYGGDIMFFWGVGKPFLHNDAAYVVASKVGGFGPGFFVQNEGVLFRSPNLLTEHDPSEHEWETLPEGDVGLRTPEGGGPIAGEFNATPMNDGSLYGTFRTIDGWSCHACSRDEGRNWDVDWMSYTPGGRRVKNPRSANFVRRLSNGKYIYWFCFHGGKKLGEMTSDNPSAGYAHRNPIWMCGGVEKDGRIHWSQPEIILYDDKIGNRMSYPDFIEEEDGSVFFTETQKEIARVHQLDRDLLEAMWNQGKVGEVTTDGLVLDLDESQCAAGNTEEMPDMPALHERGSSVIDPATSATLKSEGQKEIEKRGGLALELWVQFDDLAPWQVLFDSRGEEERGILVQVTDHETVKFHLTSRAYDTPGSRLGNGLVECTAECDHDLITTGQLHQILFIVDAGPRLITTMVDGTLCDGGDKRQYGWSRFHPNMMNAEGAPEATLAPSLHGELKKVRLYDRYLLTSEGVANWEAGWEKGES